MYTNIHDTSTSLVTLLHLPVTGLLAVEFLSPESKEMKFSVSGIILSLDLVIHSFVNILAINRHFMNYRCSLLL